MRGIKQKNKEIAKELSSLKNVTVLEIDVRDQLSVDRAIKKPLKNLDK